MNNILRQNLDKALSRKDLTKSDYSFLKRFNTSLSIIIYRQRRKNGEIIIHSAFEMPMKIWNRLYCIATRNQKFGVVK